MKITQFILLALATISCVHGRQVSGSNDVLNKDITSSLIQDLVPSSLMSTISTLFSIRQRFMTAMKEQCFTEEEVNHRLITLRNDLSNSISAHGFQPLRLQAIVDAFVAANKLESFVSSVHSQAINLIPGNIKALADTPEGDAILKGVARNKGLVATATMLYQGYEMVGRVSGVAQSMLGAYSAMGLPGPITMTTSTLRMLNFPEVANLIDGGVSGAARRAGNFLVNGAVDMMPSSIGGIFNRFGFGSAINGAIGAGRDLGSRVGGGIDAGIGGGMGSGIGGDFGGRLGGGFGSGLGSGIGADLDIGVGTGSRLGGGVSGIIGSGISRLGSMGSGIAGALGGSFGLGGGASASGSGIMGRLMGAAGNLALGFLPSSILNITPITG